MLRFLVLSIFVTSVRSFSYPRPRFTPASPGQIKIAYENKFDDTGPGAKGPEAAHKTYRHIDGVLAGYAVDPDTKLPPKEKARAIANLYKNSNPQAYYNSVPKRVNAFTDNKPKIIPIILNSYTKFDEPRPFEIVHPVNYAKDYHKEHLVWSNNDIQGKTVHAFINAIPPHHMNIPHDRNYQYKPHPQVEFSIDIHNKETGDLKSAQELRDGSGSIHGYYTVLEKNGQTHTVHYQSDPKKDYQPKRAFPAPNH